MLVRDNADSVELTLNRVEGADGEISAVIKTVSSDMEGAVAGTHFEEFNETITFDAGETIKHFKINLIKQTDTENKEE